MSKRIKLIIIIIEIIVLLGLSGYRVYEYINEDLNINENNETVKKYKVTFDYGDNTVRSIEVEENKKIEFTEEPIKKGYKFDGWLLNSVIIDNNYEVKGDITLKANWVNENIDSEIKILVYEINIRQEADVNSTDLGDVHMDQVYDVLDIVETDTYTWYKIKKDNIVGYVANQKGENWVEKIADLNDKYSSIREWDKEQNTLLAFVDDKILLIDSSGIEKSNRYQRIANCEYGIFVHDICNVYNTNFEKKITIYKNNNKFGLLSIENGREITDATYDEISISSYIGDIVVTKDNLQFVMDESGKILSKGYENIVASTSEIIIVEKDGLLDIIDYQGNSKIDNLINTNNFDYFRQQIFEGATLANYILIDFENNTITIDIPFENYLELINSDANKRTKYVYNIETEQLTIEEY